MLWFLSLGLGQADFGSHFIVDQRMATSLDDGQKKISYRFTCQENMNLTAISLYCGEAQDPPGYMVSLCPDNKGEPGPAALCSAGIVPLGKSWFTLPVKNTVLSAGKVYHLVVEQDKNRGGGHPVGLIGLQNNASFSYTDFPNQTVPRDEKTDKQAEVLVFEKGAWRFLHHQPLYALHGEGFQTQGNPYDTFKALPIWNNGTTLIQGGALHPDCLIRSTGFAVRVRKVGNPQSSLNYWVFLHDYLKHETHFYFAGEAAKPDQVSTSFGWVTVGFRMEDTPKSFEPACTYVGFQTDSGKAVLGDSECEDCYQISEIGNSGGLPMAAEMTFNGGPHLSRAATSPDGGKTWNDRFEWDANIVILGPECPAAPFLKVDPIPTPVPLPRSLLK